MSHQYAEAHQYHSSPKTVQNSLGEEENNVPSYQNPRVSTNHGVGAELGVDEALGLHVSRALGVLERSDLGDPALFRLRHSLLQYTDGLQGSPRQVPQANEVPPSPRRNSPQITTQLPLQVPPRPSPRLAFASEAPLPPLPPSSPGPPPLPPRPPQLPPHPSPRISITNRSPSEPPLPPPPISPASPRIYSTSPSQPPPDAEWRPPPYPHSDPSQRSPTTLPPMPPSISTGGLSYATQSPTLASTPSPHRHASTPYSPSPLSTEAYTGADYEISHMQLSGIRAVPQVTENYNPQTWMPQEPQPEQDPSWRSHWRQPDVFIPRLDPHAPVSASSPTVPTQPSPSSLQASAANSQAASLTSRATLVRGANNRQRKPSASGSPQAARSPSVGEVPSSQQAARPSPAEGPSSLQATHSSSPRPPVSPFSPHSGGYSPITRYTPNRRESSDGSDEGIPDPALNTASNISPFYLDGSGPPPVPPKLSPNRRVSTPLVSDDVERDEAASDNNRPQTEYQNVDSMTKEDMAREIHRLRYVEQRSDASHAVTKANLAVLTQIIDDICDDKLMKQVQPRRPEEKDCRLDVESLAVFNRTVPCRKHKTEADGAYDGYCLCPRLLCDLVPTNIRLETEEGTRHYIATWRAGVYDYSNFIKGQLQDAIAGLSAYPINAQDVQSRVPNTRYFQQASGSGSRGRGRGRGQGQRLL